MKRTLVLFAALAIALSAQAAKPTKPKKGPTVPKKIYCWDEKGTRVCGDALPASAVNNARTEINGQTGLATRQVDRVLTPEEQAAAALAAQQALAQQQQQAELLQHQQQLVMAYANEAELNRAYDEKEAAAKKVMGETSKNISSLRGALIQKLEYATESEMGKKSVSAKSAQSILDLHQQVRLQEANLARQQMGLTQLQQERASNLALFKATMAQRQAASTLPQGTVGAPAAVAPPQTAPAVPAAAPPAH